LLNTIKPHGVDHKNNESKEYIMLKMLALSVSVLALMACSEQEMASAEAPVEAAAVVAEATEAQAAVEAQAVEAQATAEVAAPAAAPVQAEVAEASTEVAQ